MDREFIQELQEWFDQRYKKKEECDAEMRQVADRFAQNDERYAVINTKLSALLWGVGILCTAVIGFLVKYILGG